MTSSRNPISPTNPVAPYIGGKRNLADRICQIIDEDGEHITYAEPFIGMDGIFLRRTRQPQAEYINDRSRDVYNLFRVLQDHYAYFLDFMRFQITTQANFERLMKVDPDTLTDIQRAARFLYLQRIAFGGRVVGKSFGISVERRALFNISTLESDLENLHNRIVGVTVLNLNYSDFIDRIDREGTLFYLDPPYFGCENDYGKDMFEREDFERLANQLSNIKGRFLLSLNDTPEVREIFSAFQIEGEKTTYTIGTKGTKEVGEVLISNFEIYKHRLI